MKDWVIFGKVGHTVKLDNTVKMVAFGKMCSTVKYGIGGFHVTQVSLIIAQVKNKIAYHSIYWVNK